ncbi:MAG: hypothetical protein ABH806_02525 [Candidatus Omnitrophota bacterium]
MRSVIKRDSPLRGQSLFVFTLHGQSLLVFTVLLVGLSGIVAQVVLLRELLVSFYGNELSLGLILANWIMSEAAGVFIIGRVIDRVKNKINIFIILQVIFALVLPLSVYLARCVKSIAGVPFVEGMSLSLIFYSSLFIMLPVAFCHGALFSASCKIYSSYAKDSADCVGRIYAWETIGTIAGGVLLTYLLIPRLDSFQIAFIISALIIFVCLPFYRRISTVFRYLVFFVLLLAAYLFLSGAASKISAYAIQKQWKGEEVLDYRNSIYGNIAVVQKEGERTFFYNGLPVITTPYPDMVFVQEFGNLPLLFHPAPKDVLIIGAGAGGLINEMLKYPVKRLDYAELDPLIIRMLQEYPSSLTARELGDKRVNVINKDGRFFLKRTQNRYDVMMVGLSKPSDLSSNRLFTEEFFDLAKGRMNPAGVLALYLPGSMTYLSCDLRDLNACVLNGLKSAYNYVRVIPGDYNIFLASDSAGIMSVTPGLLTQRMRGENIKPGILVPAYLEYRLNKSHLEWFNRSSLGATTKMNRDFMPFAVYEMLIIWNKQFSSGFAGVLGAMKNLDLVVPLVLVLVLTFALIMFLSCKRNLAKLSVPYAVATTGFFGMMINLVLIFSFQVVYGYLYHKIGILISIFMAGTAVGSLFMTRSLRNIKNSINLLIKLEIAMIIFSYLASAVITGLAAEARYIAPIFIALFFVSGVFIGLEFPLATGVYLKENRGVGLTSGLFYFSDLMGGWLAGIVGGVLLLPVLGLFNTCMVIIFMKLSSLLLLVIFRKGLTRATI